MLFCKYLPKYCIYLYNHLLLRLLGSATRTTTNKYATRIAIIRSRGRAATERKGDTCGVDFSISLSGLQVTGDDDVVDRREREDVLSHQYYANGPN